MTDSTNHGLSDLPVEQQLEIMTRRLHRAEQALHDAEDVLDTRMRELDQANRALQKREEDLVERLTIENSKLLYAQRTAGLATIFWQKGQSYSSSSELAWLLGLPPEQEVTVEAGIAVLHPLDRKRVFEAYDAFTDELPPGRSHEFEHRIQHSSRGIRWLRWSLRRELDEQGNLHALYGSVRDVTSSRKAKRQVQALQLRAERRVRELDRFARQLEQAKGEAEEALRARDRFLSAVGHYLRTPLASLNGSLELLALEAHNPEETRRVGTASRSAGQLSAMIDELLEEAEGRSADITLHPLPIDLRGVLEETLRYWHDVHPAAAHLSLHSDVNLPPTILADREYLRELLDSLIGSALDTSCPIELTLSWKDALILQLDVQDDGRWAQQAEKRGSGMGDPAIRIVRRITSRMGGKIEMDNATRLCLTLPLPEATPEGANLTDQDTLWLPSGKTPAILLAEDTPTNRYVIASQVKSLGCSVEAVENGAIALERIQQTRFDAILMDVMMPVMDGEEATRAIRSLGGISATVPIIGITAHSLHAERDRLLAAGMTACLSKPVRRKALRNVLQDLLGHDNSAQASAAGSVIDTEAFRQAFAVLPEAYRQRLLDAVRTDLSTYGDETIAAVQNRDEDTVRRSVHSLKGVALSIGATGILDCLDLFRKQEITLAASFQPQLEKVIAATVTACGDLFTRHIAKHPQL
ncbi:response regulator [Altericroceibacterium spongiae]|uniref:histidine kinase n=1 Tax=Altericroceibacterium spongiae TaxID=2320269 RepID=A0A420EC93_9SPHN|nr:response regulator [Altericroceibacterium spongiae]RKF18296.1 response regulator [Altericroceibacterium spongiae]